MIKSVLAIFIALCPSLMAVGLRVATFNIGAHFNDNGNIDYSLGDPGSADFESVRAILNRINADVVALEEVASADVSGAPDDLDALAAALGYPYLFIAPTASSGGFTGPLDTSLRVVFLSRYPFLTTSAVRSPQGAKEMVRLMPAVKVDVPGTSKDPLLIAAHLKSGTTTQDRFRRLVEMRRLNDYLNAQGITQTDNYLIMGDFNFSSSNTTYQEKPTGLPTTFVLGADVTFPQQYSTDPLSYFSLSKPILLKPLQLDGKTATYGTGAIADSTIDLMLISPAISGRAYGTEVYNSLLDTSNTQGLVKKGDPLADNTSETASDHWAVFADLDLGTDDEGSYVFTTPGQTVTEFFTSFAGTADPTRWMTSGDVWKGADDGSSIITGFRAYGPASEPAFGFQEASGIATGSFKNQSGKPITALEISFTAEQWRATNNGTSDTLKAELIVNGTAQAIPALDFTASKQLATGAIPNGISTAKTARMTGLNIGAGSIFQLRFTFQQGPGGGPLPTDAFINEFHYDNKGSGVNEFIEVMVGRGYTGNLPDIKVYLYNGNGGATYGSIQSLDSFTESSTTHPEYRIFSKFVTLQDGAPDGLALVMNNVVTQFISYEGAFTATAGPAVNLASVDVGQSESEADPVDQSSIGLTGNKSITLSWAKFTTPTRGALNPGQTIPVPPQPQGIAFDNLAVTFLADTDGDGLVDLDDPDDDNDGTTDADELVFGTDPLDARSYFRPVLSKSDSTHLLLTFDTQLDRTYTVQKSATLTSWQTLEVVSGTGDMYASALPIMASEPRMFFRVKVTNP